MLISNERDFRSGIGISLDSISLPVFTLVIQQLPGSCFSFHTAYAHRSTQLVCIFHCQFLQKKKSNIAVDIAGSVASEPHGPEFEFQLHY